MTTLDDDHSGDTNACYSVYYFYMVAEDGSVATDKNTMK
jgi:hypothetical protein